MDVVQGQLIYTWWKCVATLQSVLTGSLIPSKRFEQDMTWLRAGIATRTAIDIALHRVGLLPAARQGLPSDLLRSIVRTWLLCFVVDRTLSIQLGKPNNRQWEDEVWQYVGILRGTGQGTGEPSGDDIVVAALAVSIDATRLTIPGMGSDRFSCRRRLPLSGIAIGHFCRQSRVEFGPVHRICPSTSTMARQGYWILAPAQRGVFHHIERHGAADRALRTLQSSCNPIASSATCFDQH